MLCLVLTTGCSTSRNQCDDEWGLWRLPSCKCRVDCCDGCDIGPCCTPVDNIPPEIDVVPEDMATEVPEDGSDAAEDAPEAVPTPEATETNATDVTRYYGSFG